MPNVTTTVFCGRQPQNGVRNGIVTGSYGLRQQQNMIVGRLQGIRLKVLEIFGIHCCHIGINNLNRRRHHPVIPSTHTRTPPTPHQRHSGQHKHNFKQQTDHIILVIQEQKKTNPIHNTDCRLSKTLLIFSYSAINLIDDIIIIYLVLSIRQNFYFIPHSFTLSTFMINPPDQIMVSMNVLERI